MNRREALKGLGMASAAVISPVIVAGAAKAVTSDRSAWDRAFAAMQAAKKEADRDNKRHEPIADLYFADVKAVPHVIVGPDPYTGKREPLTTKDWREVRQARDMVRELAEGRRRHDPYPDLMAHEKLYRELAAAADARDAEIERIDLRYGYSPSAERNEAISEHFYTCCSNLMEMHAPDAAALAWKVEYAWGDDVDSPKPPKFCSALTMEWVGPIVQDARRLLSNGTA